MSARFLAYSDGSSIANPGGPGGTGFVVVDRSSGTLSFGAQRYELDGAHAVTNNRMELRAVLEALSRVPDGNSVEVISDSQYVIKSLSLWIHGWRKKGWKTSTGQPVLNRDLIEAIDARQRALTLKYQWVRGHNGHPVNEIVDALAQSAARGISGPSQAQVEQAVRKVAALPAR